MDLVVFFYLSNTKLATMAYMFFLGWGEGGKVWSWCLRLMVWEEEMWHDCCALGNFMPFQDTILLVSTTT